MSNNYQHLIDELRKCQDTLTLEHDQISQRQASITTDIQAAQTVIEMLQRLTPSEPPAVTGTTGTARCETCKEVRPITKFGMGPARRKRRCEDCGATITFVQDQISKAEPVPAYPETAPKTTTRQTARCQRCKEPRPITEFSIGFKRRKNVCIHCEKPAPGPMIKTPQIRGPYQPRKPKPFNDAITALQQDEDRILKTPEMTPPIPPPPPPNTPPVRAKTRGATPIRALQPDKNPIKCNQCDARPNGIHALATHKRMQHPTGATPVPIDAGSLNQSSMGNMNQ